MAREARKSPRYAIEAAVELRTPEVFASGRTDNVSRGGMCVIVDKLIERGEVVQVSLSLVFDEDTFSEPLELPARVVWSTPLGENTHQLGSSFLNLDSDQKSYLEMFLRYLEEGLAARDEEEAHEEDTEDPFAS